MKTCWLLLVIGFLNLGGQGHGEAVNPFFAMNTIAKGGPEVVVPLLKELEYAGLAGAAGDRAMTDALAQAGLRFFNGNLTLQVQAERPARCQNASGAQRCATGAQPEFAFED